MGRSDSRPLADKTCLMPNKQQSRGPYTRGMRLLVVPLFVWIAFLPLHACKTAPQSETPPEQLPAPPAAPAWYESEIQAFEAADKASPPAPGQALFIGSSSIRLWASLAEDVAPVPVLNRGFGGSKTAEVLAVFDRIVVPYRPSIIVYYCGDNDLGTDDTDAQSAADGFLEFDRRARALWPDVQVFYIPIKASVQRWSNWPAMKQANDIVRAYCEETPGAVYLDTVSPTLMADGQPDPSIFRADGLHLNAKGYTIWAGVVRQPVLDAWTRTNQ